MEKINKLEDLNLELLNAQELKETNGGELLTILTIAAFALGALAGYLWERYKQ